MGRISVLDENMINMIAAGEVIERPASVVKELMENSIDAGAKKITVRIEDGGRKLISITDDGCGMDADDLAVAFEPHATSKLKTKDDLLGISTMGFRGEALASIGSVAQVEVISRTADSDSAHTIKIDCGKKQPVKPASAAPGTRIDVHNLFYKLPARQKFLKTRNTEMSHITEQFSRIALAARDLDLTLIHNDRQVYRLKSGQGIRTRICELLSRDIGEDLIEASSNEKGINIYALLGRPGSGKSSAKYQYVFLNGRYIRDRFIMHALKEGYRGQVDPQKYPPVFLFLEMDPDQFDVNVHPTKIEVRFDNSNLVHSQVLAVIREKLLGTNLDINASLPSRKPYPPYSRPQEQTSDSENQHEYDELTGMDKNARRQRIKKAMDHFFKDSADNTQKRFDFKPGGKPPHHASPAQRSQQQAYTKSPSSGFEEINIPDARMSDNEFGRTIQVHDSYIITETSDGFDIIDQHALHERILFERLTEKLASGSLASQSLLIPETFEVTEPRRRQIEQNTELFRKLGITIEPFGPKTYAIQAFPVLLKKADPAEFVTELLDVLEEAGPNTGPDKILEDIIAMASCKAAVKANHKLKPEEIRELLSEKHKIDRSSSCPHGRPTTIKFTVKQLDKQFKRT